MSIHWDESHAPTAVTDTSEQDALRSRDAKRVGVRLTHAEKIARQVLAATPIAAICVAVAFADSDPLALAFVLSPFVLAFLTALAVYRGGRLRRRCKQQRARSAEQRLMSQVDNGFYVPTIEEMRACRGNWLFTDGGLASGKNPSPVGGTWAWCLVQDDALVRSASGVIEALPGGFVSNNVSELYALTKGIAALPEGWRGNIVSDSKVTLYRRLHSLERLQKPDTGIPPRLASFAALHFGRVVDRAGLQFVLVDGHPTDEHLATGAGKRGQRVSKWNRWCDEACCAERARYEKGGAE